MAGFKKRAPNHPGMRLRDVVSSLQFMTQRPKICLLNQPNILV